MNLYLDDNIVEGQLVKLLVKGGNSAVRPVDVGLGGTSDAKHFEYAIRKSWIVLTRDDEDFEDLHTLVLAAGGRHPGILVVRYENDSIKDMKAKHIAAAVNKLAKAGISCTDSFIVLNQWR
jgi:predicted nuclease of predicted toxin-antitoxin system